MKPGEHNQKSTSYVTVQGRHIEVQRIAGRNAPYPELVFLHEGLGSVSHWKDFPERVAQATGSAVTVYSRYGCGNSDVLTEARKVRYMHDEALLALPELLTQLHIVNPILVGHSDGASIALIFAGGNAEGHARFYNGDYLEKHSGLDGDAGAKVSGLVLLAPHVFVEDLSVASIAQAKANFETTDLAEKLARHHRDAECTFWGWNRIWLHPDFREWNIEEYLPRITCPILAIQGLDDEYGTMAQVRAIARQSGGPVEILPLAQCRHSPQRDRLDLVLAAIAKFVKTIAGNKSEGRDV